MDKKNDTLPLSLKDYNKNKYEIDPTSNQFKSKTINETSLYHPSSWFDNKYKEDLTPDMIQYNRDVTYNAGYNKFLQDNNMDLSKLSVSEKLEAQKMYDLQLKRKQDMANKDTFASKYGSAINIGSKAVNTAISLAGYFDNKKHNKTVDKNETATVRDREKRTKILRDKEDRNMRASKTLSSAFA